MERATVERYETDGARWAAGRAPVRQAAARRFARSVVAGALRVDVGAGAGRYTADLGRPGTVVALDAARSMLDHVPATTGALRVQADVEALPFRTGRLGGAWANMTYHHVPRERLPMALADLHGALAIGAPVDLQVVHGDHDGPGLPGDGIGGRWFSAWTADALVDVVVGAGFEVEPTDGVAVEGAGTADAVVRVAATRARTLADTVGPGMRLLVCGLNPSVYSADRGVGYARPGNRFWKAVVAAGLVAPDHALDPRAVLRHHGIGITDLCKRATVASAELTRDEYRKGTSRVERLVAWLQPDAVCFVGLEGYRAAVDRTAVAGPQPSPFGGRPAYVLPSTSGLNAHSRLDDLVAHFRAVARLADRSR
jgi:TDG/mug DNA glycosylase family protein